MKTGLKTILISAFALTLTLSGCYYDNEDDLYLGGNTCDTSNVTYATTIAPIFTAYCNSCHGGAAPSASIMTDSYENVVANMSRIRGCINQESGYSPMPKNGNKLSTCELTKVDVWIRQGMPNN